MREVTFEESREILLSIMDDIDSFCRKNNIKYSITSGTLIGAIRHKGFIPWDDDLDIMMEREQYDKFVSSYRSDKYQLLCVNNSSDWADLYFRVVDNRTTIKWKNCAGYSHGLWVACLPFDHIPSEKKQFECLKKKADRYFSLFWKIKKSSWIENGSLLRNIIKYVLRCFYKLLPTTFVGVSMENTIRKYSKLPSEKIGSVSWWWKRILLFPTNTFDKYIDVDFEGRKYMAIKEYDSYMREIYGDYMQLPPEKDRVPQHGFTAYWK